MNRITYLLILLFTTLMTGKALGVECTAQQVDQALRSVTHGKGLITMQKKDNTQSGSCFVEELYDLGITMVASTGKDQSRLDCEVVLFSGVKMANDWQLEQIKTTSLNSIQVSVNSGAEISGGKDLIVKPIPNYITVDEFGDIVEDGEQGQKVVVDNAKMELVVWINKEFTAGTLTIKTLTFNQNDCKELRSGFEKL